MKISSDLKAKVRDLFESALPSPVFSTAPCHSLGVRATGREGCHEKAVKQKVHATHFSCHSNTTNAAPFAPNGGC